MANDDIARKRAMAREKRARERRFVRRTAVISAAALALIIAALVLLSRLMPGYYQKQALRALEKGNTARASALAGRLSGDERQDILDGCAYLDATRLYDEGSFDAAAEAFRALGDHENAADMAKACTYRAAMQRMEAGEHAAAKELFGTLLGYEDALYQYDLCSYRQAEAVYASGDAAAAIELFLALGDFEDARDRAGAIASAVTGVADPEAALTAVSGLDEEAIRQRAALTAARESLHAGTVAAGFYHTLALRADGSVLAAGANGSGQCGVQGWTNVVSVAAGAYHSLALLSDGRVLAVGDNSHGQCDTGAWQGVVAIAAGDYHSLALLSDGSVRSCGLLDDPAAEGWSGITAISAGAHALGAVRDNGTLLCAHPSNRDDDMRDLVSCAVSTGYTLGLTVDGLVLCHGLPLPDWDGVVAVSASPTTALALSADGRVHAFSVRGADVSAIEGLSDVIAIAAGGTHCVFALADGSVLALGANNLGQCDTDGWTLGV